MKKIRMRTVSVFVLAGLTGALLLRTSQSVQQAETRLDQLKTSIEQEKDSIRLLNAEWAYLNNPERLEKLSKQYLDLMPPQPAAIMTEPDGVPAKMDEVPSANPAAPQPVSLKSQPPESTVKDFAAMVKNMNKAGTQ